MIRRGILLSVALLLAGCVSGRDYAVPKHALVRAPGATGPLVGGRQPGFSETQPSDHWWRLYADPRLDTLVTEALAANTDLRAADANLRVASATVREVEAGRTVSTSLGAGLALSRLAESGGPLPGTVSYDLGATIGYPLDLSGKIRRAIEAARGDAQAVEATRDEVRLTIAAATARAYASACSANHQLAAAQRVLTIQRRSLDVTRRLAQGGRGTAFDVTRARTAVEQTAATLPQFLAGRTAALYQLAALLGRPPVEYPKEVESCTAPPPLPQALPIGDGMALLKRRPDVRAAERRLAADTARIGVAVADLYPQVSLGGSIGLTGPVASLGSDNAFNIGLGPLISWTFPNRRVTRAGIDQATATADASTARFDGVVLEALRQTETALSAYAREMDHNNALRRARDSAAVAADQADKLYRFGRTDFLQLLTAQNSLASAEAILSASDAALVDRQIDIFLALGGGWQR